jgi:hypothetical protein
MDTRLVATRPAHVLAFVAHDGQSGMASYLHKREDDHLALSAVRPVGMVKKDAGFRHQHTAAQCPTRCCLRTRQASQELTPQLGMGRRRDTPFAERDYARLLG